MRTYICMRTTLDIDDRLLRAARTRGAREGMTLTAVVEAALQHMAGGLRQGLETARQVLQRSFDVLVEWQRRDEQRRSLAQMDRRLMADAGITEEIVALEVSKPFWRA